jgi:hypothetical protein
MVVCSSTRVVSRAHCASFLIVLAFIPACSSTGSSSATDSGAAGTNAGGAATGGAGGANAGGASAGGNNAGGTGVADGGNDVFMHTAVGDFPNGQTRLSGVKVCVYPALTDCATTDATGQATLSLAAGTEVVLSFDATAAGHTKLLVPLRTPATDFSFAPLITSTATAQAVATAGGWTLDPTKGAIIGEAVGLASSGQPPPFVDGVTMALTPSSGTGPAYFDSNSLPNPSLSATTAGGDGLGLFGNVDPGDYEVRFSGKTCSAGPTAWKGTSPDSARAPAVAGYLTLVVASCQ